MCTRGMSCIFGCKGELPLFTLTNDGTIEQQQLQAKNRLRAMLSVASTSRFSQPDPLDSVFLFFLAERLVLFTVCVPTGHSPIT